jgi:hypothetical protein
VNVAANPTIETRAATVTIRAGTLTRKVAVTQSGATPALAVDKATIPAGAAAATYSIGVTSNLTWMATVNSAATWCTLANASGSGNGTVTVNVAKNTVAATRSATVTVASGSLTRTVTVTQDVLTAPPYAASTQTWKFGGQKWSDAIHMPGCDKTSFNQSTTEPDCRSYSSNGNTWYYYNWPYVAANASTLCPAPWRVPSMRDFQTLANNASRVQLMTAWRRGGHMMTNHEPYDLGDRVELWSTTSLNDQEASMMYVDGGYCYTYVNGTPVPCPLFVAGTDKYLGDAVQCVIDW